MPRPTRASARSAAAENKDDGATSPATERSTSPTLSEAGGPEPTPEAAPSAAGGALSEKDLEGLDPVARAQAIASSLGLSLLGKRKAEGEAVAGGPEVRGGESKLSKKVFVPVEKVPSGNWVGLILGPKGATLKKLEHESGARLSVRGRGAPPSAVPSEEDDEELHVSIVADTEEQVDAAENAINAIIHDPATVLALQKERLRQLAETAYAGPDAVGAGGEGGGEDTSAVSMVGAGEAGGEGGASFAGSLQGRGPYSEPVLIPNEYAGLVIGKGGENIKALQQQLGVHIQVQRETELAPDAKERIVMVSGSVNAVSQAKAAILTQVEAKRAEAAIRQGDPSAMDAFARITITIPDNKVGLVIGSKGTTMKAIRARTGCIVTIPSAADGKDEATGEPTRTITIAAQSMEACEACKAEILSTINTIPGSSGPRPAPSSSGYSNIVAPPGKATLVFHIPDDKVGLVIGKGGAVIKDLQARTGCDIKIYQRPPGAPVEPTREITVIGYPGTLERAKNEVMLVVQSGPGALQHGGGMGGGPQGGMGGGYPGMGGGYPGMGGGYPGMWGYGMMGMGGMGMGGMGMGAGGGQGGGQGNGAQGGGAAGAGAGGMGQYWGGYMPFGGGGAGGGAGTGAGGYNPQDQWAAYYMQQAQGMGGGGYGGGGAGGVVGDRK